MYARATRNAERNSLTAYNVGVQISREGDLDFAKAVSDMKMMELVREATLSTAGRLYSTSLLNYMK
jgi:flagellar hook-associated protein 3 FlgL